MVNLKKIFYCSLCILSSFGGHTQNPKSPNIIISGNVLLLKDSSHKLCIKEINIMGAKKTKYYIVMREIQFKKGEAQCYHILGLHFFRIADFVKSLEYHIKALQLREKYQYVEGAP